MEVIIFLMEINIDVTRLSFLVLEGVDFGRFGGYYSNCLHSYALFDFEVVLHSSQNYEII